MISIKHDTCIIIKRAEQETPALICNRTRADLIIWLVYHLNSNLFHQIRIMLAEIKLRYDLYDDEELKRSL